MKLPNVLSKESAINGLKNLGKLRPKINRTSLLTFVALMLILFVAFTIRILPIRWEIATGTGVLNLSEFDAFFEYRIAKLHGEQRIVFALLAKAVARYSTVGSTGN